MSNRNGSPKLAQAAPHDVHAERKVLGCLLREPDLAEGTAPRIREQLRPEEFFEDRHQRIARAAFDLIDGGNPPDMVAVHRVLIMRGEIDDAGSHQYLTEIWEAAPVAAGWEFAVRVVKETAGRRSLIHIANEILRDAPSAPPEQLFSRLDYQLTAVRGAIAPSTRDRWPAAKPVSELSSASASVEWLWTGCIARGHITLFSALMKAGKTTFLGHLFRHLQHGAEFVGRSVRQSRTLLVTEESESLWALRRDALCLDDSLAVLSRPMLTKPTNAEWVEFIAHVHALATAHKADLIVFDTISKFAPWRNENDSADVMATMTPLDRLVKDGIAVKAIHHHGKNDSGEGKAARGSTALAGAVDILLEMRRFKPDERHDRRRVLSGLGRFDEVPDELVIALAEDGSGYTSEGDKKAVAARELSDAILDALPRTPPGATAEDVHEQMPDGARPKRSDLAKRLQSGASSGLWQGGGTGRKNDPKRFWKD